jgi:hypothetical protein
MRDELAGEDAAFGEREAGIDGDDEDPADEHRDRGDRRADQRLQADFAEHVAADGRPGRLGLEAELHRQPLDDAQERTWYCGISAMTWLMFWMISSTKR